MRHVNTLATQHHICKTSTRHGIIGFFRSYHFPHRGKSTEADESGDKSDSPWAVVAGAMKGFNLTMNQVLYELSYANIILLGATLPSYASHKQDKGETLQADDPTNAKEVERFFNSIE